MDIKVLKQNTCYIRLIILNKIKKRLYLIVDNVKHPFNEFILLIVEFGFFAFSVLVVCDTINIVVPKKANRRIVFFDVVIIGYCYFFLFLLPFSVSTYMAHIFYVCTINII